MPSSRLPHNQARKSNHATQTGRVTKSSEKEEKPIHKSDGHASMLAGIFEDIRGPQAHAAVVAKPLAVQRTSKTRPQKPEQVRLEHVLADELRASCSTGEISTTPLCFPPTRRRPQSYDILPTYELVFEADRRQLDLELREHKSCDHEYLVRVLVRDDQAVEAARRQHSTKDKGSMGDRERLARTGRADEKTRVVATKQAVNDVHPVRRATYAASSENKENLPWTKKRSRSDTDIDRNAPATRRSKVSADNTAASTQRHPAQPPSKPAQVVKRVFEIHIRRTHRPQPRKPVWQRRHADLTWHTPS